MKKEWDFGKRSDFRKSKREPDIRFSYFIFMFVTYYAYIVALQPFSQQDLVN